MRGEEKAFPVIEKEQKQFFYIIDVGSQSGPCEFARGPFLLRAVIGQPE